MEGKKEETAPAVNAFYIVIELKTQKHCNLSIKYFCKIIIILRFSQDGYGHPMEGGKRFQNP